MAHSYTPGLRVSPRAKVLRERRLPLVGDVLVTLGDAVEAGTVVARTELPGSVTTLMAASLLGIDARDLPDAMLAKEGDRVEKDQVVARGGGFFGFLKTDVAAPIGGTIESISKITGQVLMRAPPEPLEVDAYIDGHVQEVLPNEGVVVGADAIFVQGIFGIGGEARGEIQVIADDPSQPVDPARLTLEHTGKVVVGGALADLAAIRRAIEVKVAALVVGGVPYAALKEILGYPIGVAVTGAEEVGLSLIVTEGFGSIPMAERTFELLKANVGKRASVNGATQIRAGVIRPEIVIPLTDGVAGAESGGEEGGAIEVGSEVRVIRAPNFGRRGQVSGLPPELRALESEGSVRIAEVTLQNGETVIVPRSNLERIER